MIEKGIKKGGVNNDRFEWSGKPWNPVTGCSKISPGCRHCYAESMARRFFRGKHGYPADNPFQPGVIHPDKFDDPFKMKNSSVVFVCSMGDLFHDEVPRGAIIDVLRICEQAKQHRFVILTKRAERLAEDFKYPDNVWIGVSVENQRYWNERTAILRSIKANVKIVSIEPILEPVVADDLSWCDWVIVGKESGAGARPVSMEWVRNIYIQCQEAGVPFFSKQEVSDGQTIIEYPFKPLKVA